MNETQSLAEYKVGLGMGKLIIYQDHILIKKLTSSKNVPIKNISHVEVKKWRKQLVLYMTGGAKEEVQLSRGNSLRDAESLINSLVSSGDSGSHTDTISKEVVEKREELSDKQGEKWYQKPAGVILLLILFFPAGLYLMWKYTDWNSKVKWVVTGVLVILFFIIMVSEPANTPTSTSVPSSTMSIEQQQQVVLGIEQKIYQVEERYRPVMDRYSKTFEDLSEGRGNIFDAYAAADDARKASENMRREYSSLCRDETPREMPREMRDSLRDVCSELSTSYFVRAQAFEAAARFVEDQRPSDFREFEEKINSSDRFLISAIAKLFEVKNKLGIEIEIE